MQSKLRIHLVDGRTLLVSYRDLQLRDQHNRAVGPLSVAEAEELLAGQPEPQRSSGLDLLARHHAADAP